MSNKVKLILVFILGVIVSVSISVYASSIINSKDVLYDNTATNLSANVQGAIDETYSKANTLSNRITTLESNKQDSIKVEEFTVESNYCSNKTAYKYGKLVVYNCSFNLSTADIPAGTTIVKFPEEYKPIENNYIQIVQVLTGFTYNARIVNNGFFQTLNLALPTGYYYQFQVVYLTS